MTKTLKSKDLIAAIVLLVLSIVMYTATLNLERLTASQIGSDFAPRLVAIGIFILSVVLLIQTLKDWKKTNTHTGKLKTIQNDEVKDEAKEGQMVEEDVQENITEVITEDSSAKRIRYRNVLLTTGLIALYIFLMPTIGFLLTTAVYLMIQISLLSQKKYWNIPLFLLLSVATPVVIYYVFRTGFDLMLPNGILG